MVAGIYFDHTRRAVVWHLSPKDAALLAEWISDVASPDDGLQDEAKALEAAALDGMKAGA